MSELSDELLVAHVDGQLARDQSRAVDRVLENDRVSARRAKALQAARERLEVAFDALLAGEFVALTGAATPETVEIADDVSESAAPPRRRGPLIAVALLCLALGVAAGYTLRGGSGPDSGPQVAYAPQVTGSIATGERAGAPSWQEDASRAYALFGRDWLDTSLESQENLDFVRFQLGAVLGAALPVPDLEAEGLAFARVSILRHEGEPVAQIAYLPQEGAPVALFAKPDNDGRSYPPSLHATGEVGMAAWKEGAFTFLLAARLPEDRLARLAERIRAQIAAE